MKKSFLFKIIYYFNNIFNKKIKVSKMIFIGLLFIPLSCTNPNDNKTLGQLIGTTVGAIVGSQFGSGTGKTLSTLLGSTAGFLIGGQIAVLLSEKDQEELNNKINQTLENGETEKSYIWESSTDADINARITPGEEYMINELSCRNFEKVIKKEGKNYLTKAKACRDKEGNWKLI